MNKNTNIATSIGLFVALFAAVPSITGCLPKKTRCNAATISTAHGPAELDAANKGEVEYGRCPEGTQGTVRATCGPSGAFHTLFEDCDPNLGESAPAMLLTPAVDMGASVNEDGSVRFSWNESSRDATYVLVVHDDLDDLNAGNFLTAIYAATHTDRTNVDVSGIPLDGTPIYAQLSTMTGSYVHSELYTFEDGACTDNRPAFINNYVTDDLIKSSDPTELTWTGGSDGAAYAISVGTAPGTSDLGTYLAGPQTSFAIPPLVDGSGSPVDDISVYVTLWSTYTAAAGCAPPFSRTGVRLEASSDQSAPVPAFVVSAPGSASARTAGTEITFNASGSFDAEDATEDLQFKWRASADHKWTGWKTGKVTKTYTYTEPGIKTVSIKVKDSDKLKARHDLQINILPNASPQASFTYDFRDTLYTEEFEDRDRSISRGPYPGDVVTIDASTSYDNETAKEILEVRWRLDEACEWSDWRTAKKAKISYNWPGAKEVELQVRDEFGGIDGFRRDIHIETLPYCHDLYVVRHLPGPFAPQDGPNKVRDRNRSNCRPPNWCDLQCQAMRNAVCGYDKNGRLEENDFGVPSKVPGLCMNTTFPPEEFGYHYDWAQNHIGSVGVQNVRVDVLVGLSEAELDALGFDDEARDSILSGEAWEERGKQRSTVTSADIFSAAKEGRRAACDKGNCFSLDFSNGVFPDWGDAVKSLRGFVLEIIKPYALDYLNDLVGDIKCFFTGNNCDDEDDPRINRDCPKL